MTQPESATPDYTMGFSEEMMEALRRYTAENSAAYLLKLLKPGLRVLDFGCGPGTISIGLARAVAPAELHGVDMDEPTVELARAVATGTGVDNAVFHVEDVTRFHPVLLAPGLENCIVHSVLKPRTFILWQSIGSVKLSAKSGQGNPSACAC